MNISRVATFSLALAVTVFALGYMNPSFADKTDTKHNHGGGGGGGGEDPPSGLTYTVDLRGTTPNFVARGAFEFETAGASSPKSATLNSKALNLTGAASVSMKRAVGNAICVGGDADDMSACIIWNDVFNLCGLLGPWDGSSADDGSGPTLLDEFTVEAGDWSLAKGGGRRTISFGFTIPPAQSNGTERDLSASLQLYSACSDPVNDPSCEGDDLIPTEAGASEAVEFVVDQASVHLRGKGGVTHRAVCHADTDDLESSGSGQSTVVITASD